MVASINRRHCRFWNHGARGEPRYEVRPGSLRSSSSEHALCHASAEPQSSAPEQSAPKSSRLAPREAFVRLELHYSILTELADRSDLVPAFGYGFKGGYRSLQSIGLKLRARLRGTSLLCRVTNSDCGPDWSLRSGIRRRSRMESGSSGIKTFFGGTVRQRVCGR